MKQRKQYHHGDLKRALLGAGLSLVREQGLDGFNMREVARRAKVSHTASYRHFADKSALLAAVAEGGFVRLGEALEGVASRQAGPLTRLKLAGKAYIEFALDHREEFSVMFAAQLDAGRHPSAKHAADEAFSKLVSLMRECKVAGFIEYDPLPAARIAWSHVHGLAELAGRGQFALNTRADLTALVETAVQVLADGLCGGPADDSRKRAKKIKPPQLA